MGVMVIAIAGMTIAQDSKKQDPRFHPVPMNPGPLGAAGYLTLLPMDDRSAAGPFAQMIGAIADHKVTLPPREMLGRYTTPGDPARLELWLRSQDYSKTDALIVSVDMLAYGGLLASHADRVTFDDAKKRLEFFRWFKSKYPRVPVYVLVGMPWTGPMDSRGSKPSEMRGLDLSEPTPGARKRNLQINLALLDLVKAGSVNELILLREEAPTLQQPRQGQDVLMGRLKELGLESKVAISDNTDAIAMTLVSRAVLDKFQYKLRVAVIYSSEKSKNSLPPFEARPLRAIVEEQIRAAGGIAVSEFDQSDYRLFVNAPETDEEQFDAFLQKLIKELKENRHIALADLLHMSTASGGADERIILALKRENLFDRFAAYAARHSASDTLGTAISHAMLRVFFRSKLNDRADRAARTEAAHLDFLFTRFAEDYLYGDRVRPQAEQELKQELKEDPKGAATTSGDASQAYETVSREAARKLTAAAETFFAEYFKGHTHRLAFYRGVEKTITVTGLKDLKVSLPWPRTFECAIETKLEYSSN